MCGRTWGGAGGCSQFGQEIHITNQTGFVLHSGNGSECSPHQEVQSVVVGGVVAESVVVCAGPVKLVVNDILQAEFGISVFPGRKVIQFQNDAVAVRTPAETPRNRGWSIEFTVVGSRCREKPHRSANSSTFIGPVVVVPV